MSTYKLTAFSKYLATTAFLFVLFIGQVSAQELHIKYAKNGKVRALKQGQKMYFKLAASEDYTKGKIQSFTDSSLVMFMPDEDDVLLREIKLKEFYAIKKTSAMHKLAQAGGAIVMVGGAVAIFEAPGIAGEDGSDWLVRGVGIAAVAVGLLPYLIKPTEYVQGTNAEFSIVK